MMEKSYTRKPLPRHPAVWWSRMRFRWPFLIWVAAIALAIFFYSHGGQFGSLTGVVAVVREDVASLEPGRLVSLNAEHVLEPGTGVTVEAAGVTGFGESGGVVHLSNCHVLSS